MFAGSGLLLQILGMLRLAVSAPTVLAGSQLTAKWLQSTCLHLHGPASKSERLMSASRAWHSSCSCVQDAVHLTWGLQWLALSLCIPGLCCRLHLTLDLQRTAEPDVAAGCITQR